MGGGAITIFAIHTMILTTATNGKPRRFRHGKENNNGTKCSPFLLFRHGEIYKWLM
jgi:hypothetical protein